MAEHSAGRVTELLRNGAGGNRQALDQLMPLVYDELRRLAGAYLREERRGHTLQATAVANEAYLRLVDQSRMKWQDRAHFFAIAAQFMRRILVDHARAHNAAKRGGGEPPVRLETPVDVGDDKDVDVANLDDALESLAVLDSRQARIVELRFFGGLTVEEVAAVLGASIGTVKRDWRTAKIWLYRELTRHSTHEA